VVDKMMSPGWLEQLRQPFTEQEMKAFYKAIPPDYRGSEYSFNPESAPVSESGYPEPLSAFKSKDKLTAIDAIIRLGGAAVLGAGALSALGGAAGAGAGAAGAGGAGTAGGLTTFAPTAAASQMGALAGTTSAATAAGGAGALSSLGRIAKFIGDIPSIVGEKVAAAFGNQTIGVQSARMLGNAVISGGVTGARGGNLEDILKSAALAAGLTYVSDKAIKAVAENLRGSGVLDAVKDIPGGDITKIDPSIAGNIANNVAQGLDQFTITTFAPSAAVAGLTTTGVLAGTQAALDATEKPEVTVQAEKPVDTVPVVTSPVDAAKPDVTVTTSPEKPEGPPIVTSPVDAAKPDVTVTTSPDKPEGPPVVTSPVDAGKPDVTVTTSPDKPEGPPVVTSPVDAGKPDVTVTTSPDKPEGPPVVTSPVDAGKPEVTVTTSPDKPAVETPPVVVTPPADQKPTDQKPDEKKPDEKKKEEDPLASLISKYGTFENFLKLLGAFGAAGSKTPTPPTATAPAFPSMGGALPKYEIKRTQLSPDIDYYTYGTRPEAKFFEYAQPFTQPVPPVVEPPPADVNPPKEEPVFALGGLTGYAHGGSNDSRYVDGPGSGRDDKIPALLSDGEYVMDAETLALLGDGSTKEGARRMDEFRAKIRQHKGRALSRGRISPNAKSPENYMGGGLA
jgi:hypothetical protein